MLAVQQFLRSGGTLADLTRQYAIRCTPHRACPALVGLEYGPGSPLDLPLVQECRGLVLDQQDDWRVIARGFDKFFNTGDPLAAPIDWATARVEQKVDGTLCLLYPYHGQWYVGTTGTPDAAGRVGDLEPGTFADLFWTTWAALKAHLPTQTDGLTYLFELTTPANRVVCRVAAPSLTLLAVRHVDGGYATRATVERVAARMGVPPVRTYPLTTLADIQATFADLDPLDHEGYVVVDEIGQRVKVKHPGYVRLHAVRWGTGQRALLDVVRRGQADDVQATFPMLAPLLAPLVAAYNQVLAAITADWHTYGALADQKAFALAVRDRPWAAVLFALRSGKAADAAAFLVTAPLPLLERLLQDRLVSPPIG